MSGKKGSGKNTAAKVLVEKYGFKEYNLAKPLKELVSKVFDIPFANLEDNDKKDVSFTQPRPITVDHVHSIIRECSNLLNIPESFKKSEELVLKYMTKKVTKKSTIVPVVQTPVNGQVMPPQMMQQREYKTFNTPREILQFVGTDLVRDCISSFFWPKVLDKQIAHESKVVITDVRFFEERQYVEYKEGLLLLVERPTTVKSGDTHASETSLGDFQDYDYVIYNDSTIEDLHHRLETVYNYEQLKNSNKITPIKDEE